MKLIDGAEINQPAVNQAAPLRGKLLNNSNSILFVKELNGIVEGEESWRQPFVYCGLWLGTSPLRSLIPFHEFHNSFHFTIFAFLSFKERRRAPANFEDEL